MKFKIDKNYPNYKIFENGEIFSYTKNKFLNKRISNTGYYFVELYDGFRRTSKNIHRLVAENFIPNPFNLYTVNHINGDKLDNNVSNLEWMSLSENLSHAHASGLMDNLYKDFDRLSEDDLEIIKLLTLEGASPVEISKAINRSVNLVYKVLSGKSPKYLKVYETVKSVRIAHRQALVGSSNNQSKLTECDVVLIRTSNLSADTLATKFNVNVKTIRDVLKRRTWKHVQ